MQQPGWWINLTDTPESDQDTNYKNGPIEKVLTKELQWKSNHSSSAETSCRRRYSLCSLNITIEYVPISTEEIERDRKKGGRRNSHHSPHRWCPLAMHLWQQDFNDCQTIKLFIVLLQQISMSVAHRCMQMSRLKLDCIWLQQQSIDDELYASLPVCGTTISKYYEELSIGLWSCLLIIKEPYANEI